MRNAVVNLALIALAGCLSSDKAQLLETRKYSDEPKGCGKSRRVPGSCC
jgi:hypothetical protein